MTIFGKATNSQAYLKAGFELPTRFWQVDGAAKALADEFGITHANLKMIVNRKTWRHV